MLLLERDRSPSACIISRGVIETYAFARLLSNNLEMTLNNKEGYESIEEALNTALRFTNSSKLKENEQKKLSEGTFNIEDYSFTEQAVNRMLNSLACSEYAMNALRALYKDEQSHTNERESQFELLCDALSERVHPSQTSIFT